MWQTLKLSSDLLDVYDIFQSISRSLEFTCVTFHTSSWSSPWVFKCKTKAHGRLKKLSINLPPLTKLAWSKIQACRQINEVCREKRDSAKDDWKNLCNIHPRFFFSPRCTGILFENWTRKKNATLSFVYNLLLHGLKLIEFRVKQSYSIILSQSVMLLLRWLPSKNCSDKKWGAFMENPVHRWIVKQLRLDHTTVFRVVKSHRES